MAYRSNPFLERVSERTTSDQEFVRTFSPKLLERLPDGVFGGGVHMFRSPPGGGKTTLLRAFTPAALRAFWNARQSSEMIDSFQGLVTKDALDRENGPRLLGIFLSCASGFADLPPGLSITQEGLFRALLDCRVVLRTLRSLATFLGFASTDELKGVAIEYDEAAKDLRAIPASPLVSDLVKWAEECERAVYSEADSLAPRADSRIPAHVRFEGALWLQSVRFVVNGAAVAPLRLLMIDDLHKLRRKQRTLLIEELSELRPTFPVWLAERTIAIGDQLLSQGVREGREIKAYPLEDMWATKAGHQFASFAQNILDRRLFQEKSFPGPFASYLRSQFNPGEVAEEIQKSFATFQADTMRYQGKVRYQQSLESAAPHMVKATPDAAIELFALKILLARDEAKRQLSLEIAPLTANELDDRDSPQVKSAAEIFLREDAGIPYYFGIDRLCSLATSNVEELLAMAAALYDALQAKEILRRSEPTLSPREQEKILREVAKRKREFIPKNHTEGTRAQRLLDAIGDFCRGKTFQENAPYAPGVTGIRLSQSQLGKLDSGQGPLEKPFALLKRVLSECVAENLLVARSSQASGSREGGTVLYLNRLLGAHFGLPVQMGGWQDVTCEELLEWIERGRVVTRRRLLDGGDS